MSSVSFSLSVPICVTVEVHEIEGGGFWGEVRPFPGCVAQAETLEELRSKISLAIRDWWAESGIQTEEAARELAAIQGSRAVPDGPYPLRYDYQPPPSWTEADEDE
jgi:predicted RNase H-like HicB family nuclease